MADEGLAKREPSFLPWSALIWLAFTPPLLALLFEPQGSSNPLLHQLGTIAAIWLYTVGVGVGLHAALNAAAPHLLGARLPRALGWIVLLALGALVVTVLTPVLVPAMVQLCPGVAGHGVIIYVRGLLVTAGYIAVVRLTVSLRRRASQERERAHAERRAAVEARWQALQARTHPHFLFNTLNTAMSLVSSNPELAESTLERLASLLRYALEGTEGRRVPLGEELDAVRDYLEIERTRFGDRLRFEIDVDPKAERALVPPMMVQPLVENAVLHGLAARIEGGIVRVVAKIEDAMLVVAIEDDGVGPGGSARKGTGAGLSGARERLSLAYGERATLETGARDGGGFVVRIQLPHEATA